MMEMPATISRLPELARNLWWSWHPEARQLFEALRSDAEEPLHHNPVEWLRSMSQEELLAKASDPGFVDRYRSVLAEFDAEMTGGMGVNIHRVFTGVFAFGAALGGLSGVIAGPIQSAYPPMAASILIPALIVVVVGGLGSLKGSLVGSLIIGQAETFGKAWLPGASMLMIYLVMAAIVLLRPQGLFGRPLK